MTVFFIQALPYGLLSLGGYLLTYDVMHHRRKQVRINGSFYLYYSSRADDLSMFFKAERKQIKNVVGQPSKAPTT